MVANDAAGLPNDWLNPWLSPERPMISAHKGHCAEYPEQTMEAFEAAIDLGAQIVEVDVRWSRDRRLVLIHDPDVDRTTNGSSAVERLTLEELQRLDAGAWFGPAFAGAAIPTAESALELVLGRGRVIVFDIKGPSGIDAALSSDEQLDVARAVARLIRDRGAQENAVVASFSHPALAAAKAEYPDLEVAPWMPEDRPADPIADIEAVVALEGRIMVHTHSLLTDALVTAVHAAGIALWAWTTTDRPSLNACLAYRPDALDGGDVVAMQEAIAAFAARSA